MKRLVIAFILLTLLLPAVVGGHQLQEDLDYSFDMTTSEKAKSVVTYTLLNTGDRSVHVTEEIRIPLGNIQHVRVSEMPAEGSTYRITEDEKLIVFQIDHTLSQQEAYVIRLEGIAPNAARRSQNNWGFYWIGENPNDRPISLSVRLLLPRIFLREYEVHSIFPGGAIGDVNGRKSITWSKELQPGESLAISAEYSEKLQTLPIAFLAFVLVGASLLLLYPRWRKSETISDFLETVPGGGDLYIRMEKMLDHAKKEVLITSMWIFYIDWFLAKVKPLIERGVTLKIVTAPPYELVKSGRRWDISENKRQGFSLRRLHSLLPPGIVKMNENVHSKMIIVDEKEVLVTSANLTHTGLWENYESGVWIKDERLAKSAKQYFDELWNDRATVPLSESVNDPQAVRDLILSKRGAKGGK
ncbi:MAG: phospholipase D family protein [Methanocellales archaeon]|nr:phospholipase D family protein [Methanocellales archaeon]